MSRVGKINWKKMRAAMVDSLAVMVAGLIIALFALGPALLCFYTGSMWWLILYPIVFFIANTWEKYNER